MKPTTRLLTAVLLTSMMMLSGCLGTGTGDDTEDGGGGIIPTAQGSTVTTIVDGNYIPIVHATQMGETQANIAWAWENETTTVTTTSANGSNTTTTETTSSFYNGTLTGINVTLYHSAIDPEGTSMSMGWDLNLDGAIDIPVSRNSGFTTINISVNQWHEIPTTDASVTTVAFLAIDLEGEIGIAVIDVYSTTPEGPWSEQHLWPLGLYAMSGKDAQGTPGTGTADNLIMLTMDHGRDINWAVISVKLSIDGAAPVTCDNPGVQGTSVCSLVEFGNTDDQVWSVGDGVTVVENGQDICSGSCSIDVTITDIRQGVTIDITNGVVAE
jgi:predicted small secreted protein